MEQKKRKMEKRPGGRFFMGAGLYINTFIWLFPIQFSHIFHP